jgi:predicted nucleic acid-binding protein
MYLTAVIDNVTLVNLTKLKHYKIFDSLHNLFSRIHIPQEVRNEYERQVSREPERIWILEKLRPNEGFYSACDRYDTFVLVLIRGLPGIDKGEAEAVAQFRTLNSNYILSDDKKFKKAIYKYDASIKVLSTLHIIVMLDILNYSSNTKVILKELYFIHHFSSKELRLAYKYCANDRGIHLDKKTLNDKCSFKALGLK